jgi:fatty acid/phospholipid biosynthesis enzyme
VDNFVGNLWMKGIEGVDREVFHRIGKKITAGCTQGGNLQKIRGFCPRMRKKVEISHTYPQVINKLWIR